MKKLMCMLLVVVSMLSLIACSPSGGVSQADYDNLKQEYEELKAKYEQLVLAVAQNTYQEENLESSQPESQTEAEKEPEPQIETEEETKSSGKFDAEAVVSQLELEEYTYNSEYRGYLFLAIKNNSEYNIEISISAKFYNGENIVGAKTDSQEAFESGTETILYFQVDEPFTRTEYEISVSEETRYDCVVSELSYESTPAKEKEIVSVTNNGEYAAEYVKCYALFFEGGNLVWFDTTYFKDQDGEFKPGKTITKEIDCRTEYDDVKFYFTGRR